VATKANAKQSSRQGSNNRGGNDSFYIPPPVVSSNPTNENSEVGFLIAFLSMVVVFGLLLPILGFMYLDILEAKMETKRQQEQVQRLINQAKKEKEDK
jgi:hypothetical protein|tara:strand:+ start:1321 stop:1614 length:294 start_codon:yes stop_codon:yes gene_type:complete